MTCFWPLPGKQKYWPLIPPASHLADATLLLPWGEKMLQKGVEFKQQNKMRFKMNQKLTRNVGLKAGKIMDPSNQNWNLTHNTWFNQQNWWLWWSYQTSWPYQHTKKKNGQNGFPSKHLTLWNMGIGSLPCSVVLVWLVRIYPIYPKITQVQPNVANRCLL